MLFRPAVRRNVIPACFVYAGIAFRLTVKKSDKSRASSSGCQIIRFASKKFWFWGLRVRFKKVFILFLQQKEGLFKTIGLPARANIALHAAAATPFSTGRHRTQSACHCFL